MKCPGLDSEEVRSALSSLIREGKIGLETIRGLSSHRAWDAQVKHLILELACPELEKIVEKQRVYNICEEVRNALNSWSKTESSKPVVSLEEFHKICQEQKELTLDEEVQKVILAYLNDMGDVIYFRGLNLIVVKPKWFGTNILRYIVHPFEGADDPGQRRCWTSDCILGYSKEPPLPPSDGILTRDHVEDLVACSLDKTNFTETIGISVESVVQLMIHLEICFEEDPGNQNFRLFFPTLFDYKEDKAGRGQRKLEWSPRRGNFVYLGRRLQCKDESTVFLTPGFFHRMQVHLLLYMRKKYWTYNQEFEMGRNLIRFTENGHDICIEYSDNVGYFVDIMVRSSRPYADALKFVEENVIEKIYQFCASPQGCQGVELVEAVVRPTCVQQLMVCTERKAHSVLVSFLRDEVKEDSAYEYSWEQSIPNVMQRDSALYLLGELSPEYSNSAASSSSVQKLPVFYLRPDPGFWINLTKRISVVGLKPFKLHLYCNYDDNYAGSSSCLFA